MVPMESVEDFEQAGAGVAALTGVLGPLGGAWTFRVLNGEVAQALGRLAEATDAAALIVGGQRPGRVARMGRLLEGSVSVSLTRLQARPVLIVPHSGA